MLNTTNISNKGKIRLCSLNTRGLGNFKKRRDLFHYLRQKNFDVICLQDTHFSKAQESFIESEWGYKVYFSSYPSQARGTAILFKNSFELKIHKSIADIKGNFILLDVTIENFRLTLGSVYGPNSDDPNFYHQLNTKIKELHNDNVILTGDWNILQDPQIDGKNYKNTNNPKAREALRKTMSDLNLADIWREENPGALQFTWRRALPNNQIQMGRLDYFLVSEPMLTLTADYSIELGYRSDHSIITLSIKLSNDRTGKTFWKFNNELLYDEDFIQKVKMKIKETKQKYAATPYNTQNIDNIDNETYQPHISPNLFFEMLLLEIRGVSIQRASYRKKERDSKIKKLENELISLSEQDCEQSSELFLEKKKQSN